MESTELLRAARALLPRPDSELGFEEEEEVVGEQRRAVLLAFAQVARAGESTHVLGKPAASCCLPLSIPCPAR